MKKHFMTPFLLFLLSLNAFAEKQLLINGTTADRNDLSEINFKGDNLLLSYPDGSSMLLDLEQVEINFSDTSLSPKISAGFFSLNAVVDDVIALANVNVGDLVQIFNADGRLVYAAKAEADSFSIPASGMAAGSYILKIGGQVVKFVKK